MRWAVLVLVKCIGSRYTRCGGSGMCIDKEYRSMVVYLDTKEEVGRFLAKMMVTMVNGECAYTRSFFVGRQPARCYRCHLYGHLQYRC